MAITSSFLTALAAILLFTSFIKIATTLTVLRYGIGLTGIEFGIVCLLVAFGLAVTVAPPELSKIGFPTKFFSDPAQIDPAQVSAALLPYMQARLDPEIVKTLSAASPPVAPTVTGAGVTADLPSIAPAFLISELKGAVTVGCLILIPFVVVDLLIAHLLTLVGVQSLNAQVVSLPLKLLLFLAVDGWGLLAKKLLGI